MTTSAPSRPRSTGPSESRRETMLADFTLTPVSPQDRRRAALAVCSRAATVDEARDLLEALGLVPDTGLSEH